MTSAEYYATDPSQNGLQPWDSNPVHSTEVPCAQPLSQWRLGTDEYKNVSHIGKQIDNVDVDVDLTAYGL